MSGALSFSAIALITGSLLWGAVLDKFGGRRTIITSVLGLGLSISLFAASSSSSVAPLRRLHHRSPICRRSQRTRVFGSSGASVQPPAGAGGRFIADRCRARSRARAFPFSGVDKSLRLAQRLCGSWAARGRHWRSCGYDRHPARQYVYPLGNQPLRCINTSVNPDPCVRLDLPCRSSC